MLGDGEGDIECNLKDCAICLSLGLACGDALGNAMGNLLDKLKRGASREVEGDALEEDEGNIKGNLEGGALWLYLGLADGEELGN